MPRMTKKKRLRCSKLYILFIAILFIAGAFDFKNPAPLPEAEGYTAEEIMQREQEIAEYKKSEQEQTEKLIKAIEQNNEAYREKQEQEWRQLMEERRRQYTEDSESWSFTENDEYLMARLAMAEQEDGDITSKALVIRIIINRVESDNFPDTVATVIFEKDQFTPIYNGRWEQVEPDAECYEALELVKNGWDESQGATYFELTTSKATWHNTSLIKLFEHETTTYYRE